MDLLYAYAAGAHYESVPLLWSSFSVVQRVTGRLSIEASISTAKMLCKPCTKQVLEFVKGEAK